METENPENDIDENCAETQSLLPKKKLHSNFRSTGTNSTSESIQQEFLDSDYVSESTPTVIRNSAIDNSRKHITYARHKFITSPSTSSSVTYWKTIEERFNSAITDSAKLKQTFSNNEIGEESN